MSTSKITRFTGVDALHDAATKFIAEHLRDALARQGEAEIFLSGGSTPKKIYQNLSQEVLDWNRVTVGQVDERWVGLDDPGSNGAMIKHTLLKNEARSATFLRMKSRHITARRGCVALEKTYSTFDMTNSLAVLGMGTDGHIAGWFPESDGLSEALDINRMNRIAAIHPIQSDVTGPYLERITLTLSALSNCSQLLLLTTGAVKEKVLSQALKTQSDTLPISHLLKVAGDRLTLMHAG